MDFSSLRQRAPRWAKRSGSASQVMEASPSQPHAVSVLEAHEQRIIDEVRYYTMVSSERLLAIMDAVKYVVGRSIPGALVECGVWRGGSVLAMIKTLQLLGVDDREIYLYDTFEGMTRPGEADTSPYEQPALATWEATPSGTTPWSWAFDSTIYDLEFVQNLLHASGYPTERIHFVKGPVEATIPANMPDCLAVLRLDTDWYDSTLHELVHLYPRMTDGGVLIVDDYGHWEGARKAVDEYFARSAAPVLLSRTDYSGRMAIKH